MGIIGKLISNKIETFILNTVEKRFGYNVKGETYGPSGDDSPGLEDDRVYLGSIDGQGRSVVIGNLVVSQGAEAGEKILYSRDTNGNVKAKIYIKKDGGIEIEGAGADVEIFSDNNLVLQNGTDFAMRFNEFKTQIDQLRTDHDSLATKHNTHIHITTATVGATATPGTISPTTTTESPTTSDFTNVKIDNINVPAVGE
jgi:hypothetical protein